jgi:branched-chain amino acid transport system substrate-binding protein
MLRIHKSRPVARAVVALAGASLFVTACGAGGNDEPETGGEAEVAEGDTTGITAETIKIGTHMPLTGVAAPGYSDIPTGSQAYFDYVNANGGVCDRQIEYVVRDDGYNPTNTVQVTNQLVLQDEVALMQGGLGTPTHSAVLEFLNQEEVPDLFVSSGALAWNQPEEFPWTFGWQPNYTVEGKILGKYIAETFPDAKVGLFLQGDDFGRDGAIGAKMFLEDQIVSEVTYTPGNTDIGPQMSELQASGADLVIGFNVPAYTALSQLAGQRLNYKPQWAYSNVGADATLVGSLLSNFSKGAVAGEGALEGIISTKYIPTVEEPDNPWTQLFTQVWEEHGNGKGALNNFRVYGMSQAYTTVSALKASCDDLSREGIVETLEQEGSDFEGPWLAPIEYTEESHRGITGVSVIQIEGGVPVKKTEVQTTDVGDEAVEEFTEEPFTPDEDGIPGE